GTADDDFENLAGRLARTDPEFFAALTQNVRSAGAFAGEALEELRKEAYSAALQDTELFGEVWVYTLYENTSLTERYNALYAAFEAFIAY
ncbi:MAG: hypothetical protein MJ078_02840, partial [Clostridia bacterium]|nr:hypothetical protein [Clostridia bacterium]